MSELNFPAGYRVGEHEEYTIIRSVPLSKDVKNSFAEVYLAVKKKTRKKFAVKVLCPSVILKYDRIIDDFQKEIKLLMNLNHRYIIRIEDYGTVKDADDTPSFYLITEYIPSGQLLARTYTIQQIIQLSMQMCEGLRYLHSEGVIHRDVKPDNILLSEGKIVKIMDFGIAKILGKGDPVSSVVGSPAYAAPEQIHRSGAVTERSDVYALGKTIYSMAAHKIPAPDIQITEWQPDVKRESWSGPLMDVIRLATSVNPDDRFGSMEEFKIALVATSRRLAGRDAESQPKPALTEEYVKIDSQNFEEEDKGKRIQFSKSFTKFLAVVLLIAAGIYLGIETVPYGVNFIKSHYKPSYERTFNQESLNLFENAQRLFDSGPQFHGEAQRILEEMAARFPRDPRPYSYLGWIYMFEKLPEAALTAWKKAVELNHERPAYRIALGLTYYQLGRKTEACEEWEKVLLNHPESSQAKILLEIANRSR